MDSINSNTNGASGTGAPVSSKETSNAVPVTAGSIVAGNAKVAVGFTSTDTDAELIVDSGHVYTSMSGNAAYPTPLPTLANLFAARAAFIAAVDAARGNRIGIAARREQRQILASALRTLAHYVQVASVGNLPVLLSSGFPAQRSRTAPVGELPAPENLRLTRGKVSGQAIARCRAMTHAKAYQWRIAATATPTAWGPVITTFAASNVFNGLAPLTSYIAEVCVVGKAGPSDWSEGATVVVL
jgi:hypothetical protein